MSALTYTLLDIKGTPSTAYHPQTDGQTERVNQEVEQYLRAFVNHRQDDWADWVPIAEFAYNNHVHAGSRNTPFCLDTGQDPRMGVEPRRTTSNQTAADFMASWKAAENEAKAALRRSSEDMARHYNRKRQDPPSYQIGDHVYLKGEHIKSDRPVKKLDWKWYGPFPIAKILSKHNVVLTLPASWRVHPVFHVERLRKSPPQLVPEQARPPPPPPNMIDGHEEYEVAEIVNSRWQHNRLEYLVRWRNYPDDEMTWEPLKHLQNAQQAIRDFHTQHPTAIKGRSRQP